MDKVLFITLNNFQSNNEIQWIDSLNSLGSLIKLTRLELNMK
jgi:hypothetical protein